MYKSILGPDNASTDITMRCILGVPRSGNTFVYIFLQAYNTLLKKQPITDQELSYLGLDEVLFSDARVITDFAECPGFRTFAEPENFAKWDTLCNSEPISYFIGTPPVEFTSDFPHSPAFLRSKMVFLFRNPLDQVLSSFVRCTSSTDPEAPKVDLETFIRDDHMIDWYIKLFYSFHVVRQHHPDMLLFVPYEQLMTDKPNTLRRILTHLDLPFDQVAFIAALELTSMESLQAVEQRIGESLRGGQGEKHIHSGKTGLWQAQMSLKLVEYIEERLNLLGLSLKMFTLAEKLDPQFAFLEDYVPATVLGTIISSKSLFGWQSILQRQMSGFGISDNTRLDPKRNPHQLVIYSKPGL